MFIQDFEWEMGDNVYEKPFHFSVRAYVWEFIDHLLITSVFMVLPWVKFYLNVTEEGNYDGVFWVVFFAMWKMSLFLPLKP